MSERDPYLFPAIDVLRNKLGITDAGELDMVERRLVTQRIRQGAPNGMFDLKHLQAIHRHLFQDVYEWAGQVRTVEISKGESQFQFRQYIETGMADVFRRLRNAHFLRRRDIAAFAKGAGQVMGDINYVHPFREGNGRVQLQYLKQLGAQAGYNIRLDRISREAWMEASVSAHRADYGPMTMEIVRVAEPIRIRDRERDERGR